MLDPSEAEGRVLRKKLPEVRSCKSWKYTIRAVSPKKRFPGSDIDSDEERGFNLRDFHSVLPPGVALSRVHNYKLPAADTIATRVDDIIEIAGTVAAGLQQDSEVATMTVRVVSSC